MIYSKLSKTSVSKVSFVVWQYCYRFVNLVANSCVGLILIAGGSGGGIDVIAMWAEKKLRNASVGKISLYFNVLLYAIMLFLFDVQTVIYSLIFTVVFTLALDRTHYQNINVRVMIFTKKIIRQSQVILRQIMFHMRIRWLSSENLQRVKDGEHQKNFMNLSLC